MSVERSSKGYVGLIKQTAKGTSGTADFFIKFLSESINSEISQKHIPEGGDGRNRKLTIKESVSPSGDIEFYARPEVAARMFRYCLGSTDLLKGTAKTGGSGVLASEAAAAQAELDMTLATTLTLIVYGDILQVAADYAAAAEFHSVSSMAGHAKGGGGSSTVASEAAAGQKDVNVADATNFSADDYISIGETATIEIHKIAAVDGTKLTMTANLNFTQAIAQAVVEVDTWVITLDAVLANTHAIAVAVTEVQAPYFHKNMPTTSSSWLTIERDIATLSTELFADCKVASLTLGLEAGQPIKMTATILGISSTEQAAQETATYEDTLPFIFQGGSYYRDGDRLNGLITDIATVVTLDNVDYFEEGDTIRIDDEEILLGTESGSTFTACTRAQNSTTAAAHADNALVYLKISNIKSAEITIDNKCHDDIFTTAITRYDILDGLIEIAVSFVQLFERAVDQKRLMYGSGSTYTTEPYSGQFRFKVTRVSAGTTYTMEVELPKVVYDSVESNLDPDTKPLEISCAGQALYTSAALPAIITQVSTGDDASY